MSGNGLDNGFGESYLLDLEIETLTKSKKKKDLCEELFPSEISRKSRKEKKEPKEFADFFTYKIKDLREAIDHIKKEISVRFEMKKEFDKELDYQLSKAAFSLSEFKRWGLGYNTGVDVKRNMLEKQLTDFRREKRRTELQCWEDIISLRKDLRNTLEEYKGLLNRKELLK
jgi:hypothetical protein